MRYLSLAEVVELHRLIVEQTGGSSGLCDMGALESTMAQPRMTFGGNDLYPSLVEKAAAICFSLVKNHPSPMATIVSGTLRWRLFWP
jgi:death on curing protein